ncbi:MAG: 50S ribosomal protein L4 [Planctomycetota bacterium]|nr:MAG: 50S ribosomal protein L4 [Planctomycetota bacterium]
MHAACVMYQANKRRGTHSTRGRSELKYSNRKPWRQKGTGRARAGTRRSPLWRGGGTIFGPKPRDYRYAMPKKARRRATQSALLSKLRDGETVVVDGLAAPSGKTREVAAVLRALGLTGQTVLIAVREADPMLVRACRNLPNVTLLPVSDLNAYELIRNRRLLITRDGLDAALELWGDRVGVAAKES